MTHVINSTFILSISAGLMYISYLYAKNISKDGFMPTTFTFFMVIYVAFFYIGSVLLNVITFPSLLKIGVYENKQYVFNTWVYSTLSLLFFWEAIHSSEKKGEKRLFPHRLMVHTMPLRK